ncbi:DUF6447 family protein [Thiosulfativibrio zosterae]|uniref:Uncharacterized protein n=1 Tax=Thiosulfativibrio zosterae TaxID=2675053 RepID=A0A6F8PQM4_9GAMM|nr:DUF6447 family protein [Thiosulfativibrio zosterae]BBP44290.1 hypothetical protein THMIRHAT_20360 [Thiosulfativibrio zosterae]
MNAIKINEKDYNLEDLSDTAKQQLANIQAVDAELARLNSKAAIYQTARNAYVNALATEVEATPSTKPVAKKTAAKSK